MRISKLVVLSLTIASTHALAFQAKEPTFSAPSQAQLKAAENAISGHFYRQDGARAIQASAFATCAAVPVAGCNCPFCTMLRSRA